MIENFLSENNCIISNKIIKPTPVLPNYITFEDSIVKQICVENWGTDGEITYEQAAAVTNLEDTFKYNTEITSFNEFQYFTGLKSIGDDAFKGCTSLTSITIPNSVTSISNYVFTGCSSLTSISLDAITPPTLWFNVFLEDTNLSHIYVPVVSVDAYKTAEGWSAYAEIITAVN